MSRKRNIALSVAVGAFLVLAYYAVSPLWNNTTVDESSPEGASYLVSARQIVATKLHPASGLVSVLENPQGMTLRYENFKTINGPDLRVYLSTDLKASDFIDLGELKATEGDVNYAIPAGADLARYRYALIWCEDFGVLFNSADLQP